MCQGVIISMVKFDANGKHKRVILRGIGGHADLLKDNKKKLEKEGWTENAKSQDVISIESDFSGWNKFTVESGVPSISEMAILAREYKKIAGNARALIAHVKAVGKIDSALERLFSADGLKIYEAKLDVLYADYKAKRDALYADYKAKRDALYADYEAKLARVWAKQFSQKENRVEWLR
jgi:hypothetical protein